MHDATVNVVKTGGARKIPIQTFIAGFMSPAIDADELVVSIDFPLWPQRHGYAFMELARRHGDFALASTACLMVVDPPGRITRVAIGVGGVGPVPTRLHAAEEMLVGERGDDDILARAAAQCKDLDALSDFHGRADYRRSIAIALVHRALLRAYERGRDREVLK